MSLFPCPRCKERLEADVFGRHLKNCGPSKPTTEPHVNCSECRVRPAIRGDVKHYCVECREVADRHAAEQAQRERDGEFGPRARTQYEKRIAREQAHRDAMPITKKGA